MNKTFVIVINPVMHYVSIKFTDMDTIARLLKNHQIVLRQHGGQEAVLIGDTVLWKDIQED